MYDSMASQVYYITKKAGDIIMEYYNSDVEVMVKSDDSPVTQADLAANSYICSELCKLTPNIPIVSEENNEEENIQASKHKFFWLVDPLDGTKSFISKAGEFTVNIALIEDGAPIGGAIYIPAQDTGYFTAEDQNSYKQVAGSVPDIIKARKVPEEGYTVVASKSHRTSQTNEFIENLGNVSNLISVSSSLKLCLLAEGSADIYPRFGRTMWWDIAAGHAILNKAGGKITKEDASDMLYMGAQMDNPYFIAYGNKD